MQCFSLADVPFHYSFPSSSRFFSSLCFTVSFPQHTLRLSSYLAPTLRFFKRKMLEEPSPSQYCFLERSGIRFCHPPSVYILLIHFKLLYGSLLFDIATWTTLEIIDRIQYAAARTIFGVLRNTPIIFLEAAAHLMPHSYFPSSALLSV